jgi:hypothetical protein
MHSSPDPLAVYGLENYLFDHVGPTFRKAGSLSAFDFFIIVIWKSNRAKSKVAKRLFKHDPHNRKDLTAIVPDLGMAIFQAADHQARLKLLMVTWGFRLPMASAILTVLYPDDFTIYDVRICWQLGGFGNIPSKKPFSKLWEAYQDFIDALRKATPEDLSLRDKDRWLWGKSFVDQLNADIARGFAKD